MLETALAWCRRRRRLVAVLVALIVFLTLVISTKTPKESVIKQKVDYYDHDYEKSMKVQAERLERIKRGCLQDKDKKSKRRKKDLVTLVTDVNNSSLPLQDAKIVYCHVPKVASTSWMRVVADMAGMDKEEVDRLTETDQLHKVMLEQGHGVRQEEDDKGQQIRARLRLIFVRHPFSRYVRTVGVQLLLVLLTHCDFVRGWVPLDCRT